jgi:hypothetical protein
MNNAIISLVSGNRLRLKPILLRIPPKPRKRRPIVDNDLSLIRGWLPLDNDNSFAVPFKPLDGHLKGESFRFYCVLLRLAKQFKNPFNYSDQEFKDNYLFHKSRIPAYKDELEALGLVSIGMIRNPKLRWPKTHYMIIEVWGDPIQPIQQT